MLMTALLLPCSGCGSVEIRPVDGFYIHLPLSLMAAPAYAPVDLTMVPVDLTCDGCAIHRVANGRMPGIVAAAAHVWPEPPTRDRKL
jgi:hypothetical protein